MKSSLLKIYFTGIFICLLPLLFTLFTNGDIETNSITVIFFYLLGAALIGAAHFLNTKKRHSANIALAIGILMFALHAVAAAVITFAILMLTVGMN